MKRLIAAGFLIGSVVAVYWGRPEGMAALVGGFVVFVAMVLVGNVIGELEEQDDEDEETQ